MTEKLNIRLVKDNTVKDIPEQPVVMYEIVGNNEEGYVGVLFDSDSFDDVKSVMQEILNNDFHRVNNYVNLSEITSIELNVYLNASKLDIRNNNNDQYAFALLQEYTIARESKEADNDRTCNNLDQHQTGTY